MARYFDKRELVLIILVLMMLDFNGFCDTVIPHIVNKNEQTWLMVFIVTMTLFIDISVYVSTIHSVPTDKIFFSNNREHNTRDCKSQIESHKKELQNKMKNVNESICETNEYMYAHNVIKTIALMLIASIIVVICGVSVAIGESDIVDGRSARVLRSLPVLFVGIIVGCYAYLS